MFKLKQKKIKKIQNIQIYIKNIQIYITNYFDSSTDKIFEISAFFINLVKNGINNGSPLHFYSKSKLLFVGHLLDIRCGKQTDGQ